MRRMTVLGVALGLVGMIGCNASERGGKTDDTTRGSETFRLKGPVTATTIKQGDQQTVKLTLDRGKNFKKDVTLKADAPTGLKVEFEPRTVKASDGETVAATIKAEKDAPLGEHTVKVTATPSEGNAVDLDLKVKVEKKTD
jgi:uncharacterized membrane protein